MHQFCHHLTLHCLLLQKNLDLFIFPSQGTRASKSTYSIANFVSYDHLSSTYTSLIDFVYSVSVSETVKEDLNHPGWSIAMLDDIHALEKNHTWEWWIYLRKRNQWDVNGSSQLKLFRWFHRKTKGYTCV